MDPLCLLPFNDARECLFKADGNLYNCKEYLTQYVSCQRDPVEFKSFLESATYKQKQAKTFDFVSNRGYYDKYMG